MSRFFVEPSMICDGCAVIQGEDAHHISRVLRMKEGEKLTLCDGCGRDYSGILSGLEPDLVLVRVEEGRASESEPNIEITLLMAVPKGEKMELVVQKATELGVFAIVPVLTARCVSRPDPKAMEKKIIRWQRIALEAAKQSGRGRIPQVLPAVDLTGALRWSEKCDVPLFFYEQEQQRSLQSVLSEWDKPSVAMLIGPEGGFDPEEAEKIIQAGFVSASLGKRILRCETAPLAALSAILYHYHNF